MEATTKDSVRTYLQEICRTPLLSAEQEILILRYGLNSEPQTFRQIAENLGVGQGRIAYETTRAITKLRSAFSGQNASNF